MALLRRFAEACLTVLLPPSCGVCARPLPSFGAPLCDPCEQGVTRNGGPRCAVCDLPDATPRCAGCEDAPFRRLRAPYLYGGSVAELVQAIKFGKREDLAAALGILVAAEPEVRELTQAARALVPVPLGRRRQRQRGFNQSAVLARVLGRTFGLPVSHALRRVRDTAPQSDLPLTHRRDNVSGAFVGRLRLSGRIVLVDDVVTSGETARQATEALLAAGAEDVVVLAAARTPLDGTA